MGFFSRIVNFIKESIEELKKVTWPSKDTAISSSVVVIGFIVVFAIFLSAIDWLVELVLLALVK
ncbi:MAG: preprotein translocase subunit SecE [Spirochaetes bacterium GWF1_51_8]|nr:MAG: preprotein translocase subunit SecE [Spirochaetes bacterium GWF1_51_8]